MKKFFYLVYPIFLSGLVPVLSGCHQCEDHPILASIDSLEALLFATYLPNTGFDKIKLSVNLNEPGSFYESEPGRCSYYVPAQHMDSLTIYLADIESDVVQAGEEVTDRFLVDDYDSFLYETIDQFLADHDEEQVNLVYTEAVDQDTLAFIIEVRLTDGRIVSDTTKLLPQ